MSIMGRINMWSALVVLIKRLLCRHFFRNSSKEVIFEYLCEDTYFRVIETKQICINCGKTKTKINCSKSKPLM